MHIPKLSELFKKANPESGWVAMCLSRAGVHVAQVKMIGGRPQVLLCAFHPVSEISPDALMELCKEAKLGSAQFTTLLNASEYQMMLVDAPNVPLAELKTAIRWRIKDALNYHVDDATVDVLQIPARHNAGDRPQSLYAVAASNETIKKRMALFEKAKMDIQAIDIPEMAQRNIAALFEQSGRGLALLVFDDSGGLLTFTCDGELYLARRIEVTAGQLQDVVADARQQSVERVEIEVQRSLDYFDRQYHHINVARLLIAAPDSAGLIKTLKVDLSFPVEPLELAQVMDVSAVPDLLNNQFMTYALPTLGAALRQERRAL